MLRRVLLAGVSVTLIAGSSAYALAAAPTTAPANHARLVALGGTLVPGLDHLRPTGATAPGTPVEVDVTLADPDPAGEAALYHEIYTPGSAEYHHFLTPQQYAQRFAVPQQRYDAAVAFATAGGLRLARASLARDILVLRGTAAAAERTFGVALDDYAYKGLRFYANATEPLVPAGLGVTGVIGLNSAQRMTTDDHRPPASAPHGTAPAQDFCYGPACLGGTTPADLWSVYDQPASDAGQGETMAIFGEGDFQTPVKDLRLFENANKLPAVPVEVVETDGPTAKYTDASGDGEWDLDMQSSTGMAPDVAQLVLYFGTSLTDQEVLNMFSTWVDDPNGPAQASASFGECEANPVNDQLPSTAQFAAGSQFTQGTEKVLNQANLEGRTLFSSAGDTGSSCPVAPVDVNGVGNELFPAPNYPADSPHAVSVGGTVLYTDGATPPARVAEYGWTFTGGGSSFYFPEPAFQQGTAGLDGQALPCLYPQGDPSGAGVACRAVPDVAAQSGDVVTNGYYVYSNGQQTETGGTSLSSPLWLGMWTRIQAASTPTITTITTTTTSTSSGSSTSSGGSSSGAHQGKGNGAHQGKGQGQGKGRANGKGRSSSSSSTTSSPTGSTGGTTVTTCTPGTNGFADEALYRHAGDFFDIGGGTSSPPDSNGYYVSQPGWDYLSGLGTPDVTALMKDIDHGSTVPGCDSPSPNAATLTIDAVENGVITQISSTSAGGGSTGVTTLSTCAPVFTQPSGTASYVGDPTGQGEPQADLVAGALVNPTADTLTTVLQVSDLEPATTTLGAADEYYLYWTYHNTEYFTNVEIDRPQSAVDAAAGTAVLPDVTYNYGTVSQVGTSKQYNTVGSVTTGSVAYGKDGKVEVTVPLFDVGNPPAGSVLTGTGAQTFELLGAPGVGGSLQPVDSAGPGADYPLGLCTADPTPPVGS